MPGQFTTCDTVNVYKQARDAGCTQSVSAHIANILERSGSRIEQGEHQFKSKGDRGWRTCADPLAEVWEKELERMLQREPRLEATTLYEHLEEQYPGQYESTLRTVQQRVRMESCPWSAAGGDV